MKLRIHLLITVLLSALTALSASYRPEDVPNVHAANRTRFVSNPDGVLSAAATATLDSLLQRVWQQTTAEPVVVAIDEMAAGYDEVSFANDLFTQWQIGKRDTSNGLLILIVKGQRRFTVRTGYGLEGMLPDALCGRIMDTQAVPAFREGDYDTGTIAAASAFADILSNPEHADELKSKYANDSRVAATGSDTDLFTFMLYASAMIAVGMLAWVLTVMLSSRKEDEQERYRRLNDVKPVALFAAFFGLGLPLPALLLLLWQMHRLRNHRRLCPNCESPMRKLDEQTDNHYLTPAQDLEEQLNSIDYDVWLCPSCGEKDVIPYINRRSAYQICPSCGARTAMLTTTRILRQPTATAEGVGERIYTCRNCGNRTSKRYNIAKAATAVPLIIPGGGGGNGFGGGGFGGSFGGGITGGGGASGGW